MKNFYFCFISVCFLVKTGYAQQRIAYADAVYLKKLASLNQGKFAFIESAEILRYYFGNTLSDRNLDNSIKANNFIKKYYAGQGSQGLPDGLVASGGSSLYNGQLLSNVADGIAKFLIERGKEEISRSFIKNFKNFLEKHPEIQVVFPTSAEFIDKINDYNYLALMPAFKAAFQKDLNSLCTNLNSLRDKTKYKDYAVPTVRARANSILKFLNHSPVGRAATASLILTDGIIRGDNPAVTINTLAGDSISMPGINDDNLANTLRLTGIFSQSLRSTEEDKAWINKEEVSTLLHDEVLLNLYLGLIYEKNKQSEHPVQFNLSDGTIFKLSAFFDKLQPLQESATTEQKASFLQILTDFKQTFANMANAASDASENAKRITNATKSGDIQAIIQLYSDYASTLSGFIKSAAMLVPNNKKIDLRLAKIADDVEKYRELSANLINAGYYIKSQNYSALVVSTSSIIKLIKEANLGGEAVSADDYIKYGTFMATILEAKNSDDVKKAIEAVALPPGSYSIKQNSFFNISLNGYIGYGMDFNSLRHLEKGLYANGVYAPVGVAFTHGSKTGLPVTLFLSAFDLGGFVSYRLTNGATNELKQDIRLESIISPSAQLFLEIPGWPVAFGGGWRKTPTLVYNSNAGFTTFNAKSVFNVSVLIDIPFFTLHNDPF